MQNDLKKIRSDIVEFWLNGAISSLVMTDLLERERGYRPYYG